MFWTLFVILLILWTLGLAYRFIDVDELDR